MTQARYDKDEIQQFALNLLLASGMELEKAKVVCEILVEGDLMEHTTHGLQMLIPYLKSIEAKTMTLSGTYSILRETPSHLVMDGRFYPVRGWCVRLLTGQLDAFRSKVSSACASRRATTLQPSKPICQELPSMVGSSPS